MGNTNKTADISTNYLTLAGPGQIKPKTILLAFAVSPLSTWHYEIRAKTGWVGFRIMCQRGVTKATSGFVFQ
jgi:hypothetical protein